MGVLTPELAKSGDVKSKGKIVIGAPAGDMHEIGKDIVATVLKANGFDVVDLGPDVNSLDFIKKAKENEADIIAISALMTTTMPGVTEVIELLKEKGIREKYKVIVGGAPTNEEWAKTIGADGWAENASQAVELVNKLIG
jgi:methylmalonyl-CoA mutase cobalamin-binding domain/chain